MFQKFIEQDEEMIDWQVLRLTYHVLQEFTVE